MLCLCCEKFSQSLSRLTANKFLLLFSAQACNDSRAIASGNSFFLLPDSLKGAWCKKYISIRDFMSQYSSLLTSSIPHFLMKSSNVELDIVPIS